MEIALTINEQLAKAMKAGAQFKAEVEKIIECVCVENEILLDSQDDYEHMSDNICSMIQQIGESMGLLLSETVLDEVRKVNPRNSYVSNVSNGEQRERLINALDALTNYNELLTELAKEE